MSPLSVLIKQSFESPFCRDSCRDYLPNSQPPCSSHHWIRSRLRPASGSPLEQSTAAVHYSSQLQQSTTAVSVLCLSLVFFIAFLGDFTCFQGISPHTSVCLGCGLEGGAPPGQGLSRGSSALAN